MPLLASQLFDTYRANDFLVNALEIPTHSLVKPPHPLSSSNDRILVALKPYLGRTLLEDDRSIDLELVSGGRKLILTDQSGLVHKSANITIGWKKVFLSSSKQFSRQVIGPFASFESAQTVLHFLDKQGVKSKVAHPLDWEVWVPDGIKLPEKIKSKNFTEKIDYEIRPVLRLDASDIVLSGLLKIDAPDGLRWKGGLYQGPFFVKPDAYRTWTLVEEVPLEQYLLGVVPHEIGPSAPFAALASQAVLARTWALANANRFAIDGYHLCSDTQCQVYKDPNHADIELAQAISKTSGKVLTWEGRPISAVYHATNGGVMASANEAWAVGSVPYLKSNLDGSQRWKKQFSMPLNQRSLVKSFLAKRDGAYGNNHYLFRWRRNLSPNDLKKALTLIKPNFGLPQKINVLKRGPSGRVLEMEIIGMKRNSSIVLKLDAIRRTLKSLPSTLFIVDNQREGGWQFLGGGFGHGSGLSQAGAIDLALRGWSTQKILQHYYPGTTYESFR
ncbi:MULTISPECIES: SpoIID/LytB domain-containing protein [Prochlorococcus]|uniref:SpoIID/LytB domain-containing protein n=1 Tax=Prochlorococcus TaxID=1218 RepID=UPI00053390DA|nr:MULTISPECIES: SpoIID/LytB domain-containing protein [Prochlorococcus]KGG13689.1 putative amidase enhancer [Prochlorococcus sp. MIT 0601]